MDQAQQAVVVSAVRQVAEELDALVGALTLATQQGLKIENLRAVVEELAAALESAVSGRES